MEPREPRWRRTGREFAAEPHAARDPRSVGFTPCLFRPPYGSAVANLVSRAHDQGMSTIIWTVDPLDWRTPGTGAIVNRVLSQTRKGAIILEHDGGGNRSQSLTALPQYVQALKRRGYKFVTVSDLLGYKTKCMPVR